jgi:hypothetical protein
MSEWGALRSGKEAENYWTGRLVEELHKTGLPSAGFERVFRIRKGGKETTSKPDISFSNGGVHILSAKYGARKELEAYKSADEYKEDLGLSFARTGQKIGEVFAITYPASRSEKFHLHILPSSTHDELSFTLESVEAVASQIKAAIDGLLEISAQEPLLDEAGRMLRWGADDLAGSLKGVTLQELEILFGGHNFFESLLKPRLKGEKKAEALRLGAAYLFINQLLFYVLLSQAARRERNPLSVDYPEILPEHFHDPKYLQRKHFNRVRSKNYEPIYGIEIAWLFKGHNAEEACENLVRAILALAPKMTVPDLVGQVFQTLIPLEIRKPLGAYYTNPAAANLLAKLAVRHPDDHILDPACGSGTLLVASYREKKRLSAGKDEREMHRRFVEKEITGIDAMAFSAHLAAVNLALQQPLMETEHVRIGIADSTSKGPGMTLGANETSLPRELHQVELNHDFDEPPARSKKGAVKVSKTGARDIVLSPVDVVIMNPPFTSWDNMGESYREALKMSFALEKPAYRDALYWKVSQQAFFLLLADRFLKPGGIVAAVLPITTFTGQAFGTLMKHILAHYTVRVIAVGLSRSAFSEDTSLGECLFVAEKKKPEKGSRFILMGTMKSPDEWTNIDIELMVEAARKKRSASGIVNVEEFDQEALLHDRETLTGLIFRLNPHYRRAMDELRILFSTRKLVRFDTLGVSLKRWVLGGGWLIHYGSKALFGYRGEERALKESDRLIIDGERDSRILLRDKVTGHLYRFRPKDLSPALRRFSYLSSVDATGFTDVVVTEISEELKSAMEAFYGETETKKFLKRIQEVDKKKGRGKWQVMVQRGMTTLAFAGRLNLAAPGTTVVCCRSEKPMLLAAYGFMLSGDLNSRDERFLCLWFNSTVFLLHLMDKLTITEGPWVRMEGYIVNPSLVPDFRKFTDREWRLVDQLYEDIKDARLPSLVEQLNEHPIRKKLDSGILAIFNGSDDNEAERTGEIMRKGVLDAIEALKRTIVK